MLVFNLNSTLPPDGVTFVGGVDTRGTLDIVWSCLSILLLCTWSILHLNVPEQSTPCSMKDKLKRSLLGLFWNVAWMAVNILAPEWVFGKAYVDYCAADNTTPLFDKFKDQDKVVWSKKHTYLANMGGFAINFVETDPPPRTTGTSVPTDDGNATNISAPVNHAKTFPNTTINLPSALDTRRHSEPTIEKRLPLSEKAVPPIDHQIPDLLRVRFARVEHRYQFYKISHRWSAGQLNWDEDLQNSGGIAEALSNLDLQFFANEDEKKRFLRMPLLWWNNLQALQGDRWVLDANQLVIAREMGIISKLPDVSEDNIDDRDKGGFFVKLVAFGQTTWFAIQLINRLATRLPTSQLEIMTFAFAVTTGLTYLLLLNKPKGVQYSTQVRATRYATPAEMARIAIYGPLVFGLGRTSYYGTPWIPNSSFHVNGFGLKGSTSRLLTGMSIGLLVFGLIHCIAWNFSFPTIYEQQMWRASSIVTAAAFPIATLVIQTLLFFWRSSLGKKVSVRAHAKWSAVLENVFSCCIGLLFICARLFIIVEALRTLAFLPPKAYLTASWTISIPHFS